MEATQTMREEKKYQWTRKKNDTDGSGWKRWIGERLRR